MIEKNVMFTISKYVTISILAYFNGYEPFGKFTTSILELHQFIVNLFYVDLSPRNVVVAADTVNDVIIQFV